METLPLEMLNEICKFINWKDVRYFENALPQVLLSDAKLDVVKRTVEKLNNKKNYAVRDLQTLQSELKKTMINLIYLLFSDPPCTLITKGIYLSEKIMNSSENKIMNKENEYKEN